MGLLNKIGSAVRGAVHSAEGTVESIAAKVAEREWLPICALMQQHFARGEYRTGATAGVDAIGELLARHFPAGGGRNPDELPDRPVLL